MSKGEEALGRFLEHCIPTKDDYSSKFEGVRDISIIKKELMAFDIIVKKNVDIALLKKSNDWLDYYTRVKHRTGGNTDIIQEEFDILKEVL